MKGSCEAALFSYPPHPFCKPFRHNLLYLALPTPQTAIGSSSTRARLVSGIGVSRVRKSHASCSGRADACRQASAANFQFLIINP